MKIFDTSAVLAVVFDEPGAEQATRWLQTDDALISSVNLAEVWSKLRDKGLSDEDVVAITQHLPLEVVPFSTQQARAAGQLRTLTQTLGLSLGDRCCLALATEHAGATVVTADRPWVGLTGFDIALIR
jgi:PIN domain nuclease of toxin-antitoxin system